MDHFDGEPSLEQYSLDKIHEVVLRFLIEQAGHDEIQVRRNLINFNLREIEAGFKIDELCSLHDLEVLRAWFEKQSNDLKITVKEQSSNMSRESRAILRHRYRLRDAIVANLDNIRNIKSDAATAAKVMLIPMELD